RGARYLVARTSAWTTADEVPCRQGARHLVTHAVRDTSLRGPRLGPRPTRCLPIRCQTPRYGHFVTQTSSCSGRPVEARRRSARHLVMACPDEVPRTALRRSRPQPQGCGTEESKNSDLGGEYSMSEAVNAFLAQALGLYLRRSNPDPHALSGSSPVSAPISSERVDTPTF